jgi:hypothetical protein
VLLYSFIKIKRDIKISGGGKKLNERINEQEKTNRVRIANENKER